jgi:4-hydroxythreonine-4-phosphate dehydrogenase
VQPLALTLGEPAGIGPDLTLAVWRRRAELKIPPFYVVADPAFLQRHAGRLGLDVPIAIVRPDQAIAAFRAALPVVDLAIKVNTEPGRPDRSSAPAAIGSIRRAVADVLAGSAAAVVTNPVAKDVLYKSGFAEPGHTEFLAKLVQETTGASLRPVMLLWSPELAVVPVTIICRCGTYSNSFLPSSSLKPDASSRPICVHDFAWRGRGWRSPDLTRMREKTARSARRIMPSSRRR